MEPTFVAIVGPTASGKSALAMQIAELFGGEIVAADSRTIYKEMDIGTAKPSAEDRQKIRHHCLDLIYPNERYSVYQYQQIAKRVIEEVKSRGSLPMLVGGSGLYLDAVMYDYGFEGSSQDDHELPDKLIDLQRIASERGYDVPDQVYQNPRHLKGFIRRGGRTGSREQTNALILGITRSKEELFERIESRVHAMLKDGFVQEVQGLLNTYGEDAPGFSAPGYRPFVNYLSSKISEQEAISLFMNEHKALAKRQMTWFKRDKSIHWVNTQPEAEQIIRAKLL